MKNLFYLFTASLLFFSCQDKTADLKDGLYAIVETNKGDIILELFYDKVPITVANFVTLAEGKNEQITIEDRKGKPFYNGLKFHRVESNFMIQGGCPVGDGSGGPGYQFFDEPTTDKHTKGGILSMANAGPGTNGSQFFITHNETPWLDGKHTIFGEVVTGMDIVNQIVAGDEILKVIIIRKGEKAKKFDAVNVFNNRLVKEAEAKAKREEIEKAEFEAYLLQYGAVVNPKKASFEAAKAKTTKTASGLEYTYLKKGNGKKPNLNEQVQIHYAGYFQNGKLFDSSYEDVSKAFGTFDQNRAAQNGYQPIPFMFGTKQGMIPGFIESIELMGYGDKILVFIPAHLAYGEAGVGPIKPNTDLVFEMEMLAPKN
jgi:cyclophilin family peptidyl-prolyl cis-trans isomerase